MRKMILLIAIVALSACAKKEPAPEYHWSTIELLKEYYGEPEPALTDFDKLTLAIALTESRFQPDAVGKDDDLGILQIRPVFVEEANRVSGSNFRHEDAFDIDSSLAMFNAVQSHYNAEHDLDKAIRLHNKADWYRARVLENYELICRMEIVRAKLTSK
jgi:hypothetical protein